MYKVFYRLPECYMREIIMDTHELNVWLKQRSLKRRIVSYEKIY